MIVHILFLLLLLPEILKSHPDAQDDEQASEDIEDPFKLLDQYRSGKNEDETHDHCTDDAPEKDPFIIFLLDSERNEDQSNDKNIINGNFLLFQSFNNLMRR